MTITCLTRLDHIGTDASGPAVSDVVAEAAPKVHVLAEMTLGSHDMLTAATAIGEPRGIRLGEDVAYLGRSGLDTLALVATPALMVSGVVGFLMIGLPAKRPRIRARLSRCLPAEKKGLSPRPWVVSVV